jgi:hypothetical protein
MLNQSRIFLIRFYYSVLCFFSACLIILGYFIFNSNLEKDGQDYLVIGILGIFTCFVFLFGLQFLWLKKIHNYKNYLIHPPVQINLWVTLLWVIPAIFSILDPDFLISKDLYFVLDFNYYIYGLFLVFLGCFCIWLTYTIGIRMFKPLSFLKNLSTHEIKLIYLFVLFFMSLFFEIIQISISGIAFSADRLAFGKYVSLYQWISYIIDLRYLVIVIVAYKVFRDKLPFGYLLLLIIIQIISSFSSVFIKPFFSLALILIVTYLVARGSYRKVLYFGIVSFFILVLVIPIIGDLRDQMNYQSINPKDLIQVINATLNAFENTWFRSISFSWNIFVEKAFFRQSIVAYMPGIIMLTTPKIIPFLGFNQFFWIPTYLIPRILWLDKPHLAKGDWFGITYLNQPSEQSSSAAMTIFGEGYMYSGWIGTIFACLIFGILLSLITKNTLDAGLSSVFIALIPTIIDVENQFSGISISLIHRTIIYLFFYWLLVLISKTNITRAKR